MEFFSGFKEYSDVKDIKTEQKPEISRDALNRFEQIMGDTDLPESTRDADQENFRDISSEELQHKFDALFEEDCNSQPELAENAARNLPETPESDSEGKDSFADIADEITDNCRLPRNGGKWSGVPGNSEWKPDPDTIPGDRNGTNPEGKSWQEILESYNIDGISFENGRPDFSELSKGNVEIDEFSDNRRKNFVQADEKLAEQKGCQPGEVRQWRIENQYTWHEDADCKTMLKVPSEVHGNIPHAGGISEMKNQKEKQA